MKYTNYFKIMICISLFLIGVAIVACPMSPGLCAVCAVMSFIFWFVAVMAPDHEKYTPEYLKRL